jgi:hypothetical protein
MEGWYEDEDEDRQKMTSVLAVMTGSTSWDRVRSKLKAVNVFTTDQFFTLDPFRDEKTMQEVRTMAG